MEMANIANYYTESESVNLCARHSHDFSNKLACVISYKLKHSQQKKIKHSRR